jgi:hypothetical protein
MQLTIKMQSFMSQPLDQIKIEDVPGVGKAVAEVLRRNGINSGQQLMGTFLKYEGDVDMFAGWLQPIMYGGGFSAAKTSRCLSIITDALADRLATM